MNNAIDSAQLNFSTDTLWLLNIALGIVMFGVALDLSTKDFKRILKAPEPALIGLLSQFILLPALTFVLIYISKPTPSIALGMIMVAACPGGNVSNFMSHLSGANAALSVTLTAFSTALSILMTPFNLSFWGGLYPPTAEILHEVSIQPLDVLQTIVLILGIPLIAGMVVRSLKPALADRMGKVLKPLSILIFAALVIMAFSKNYDLFVEYIDLVLIIVFFHNALALSLGYGVASLGRLPQADRRSIAIETGIQNSGLGLLLIFSFFDGLGGMAIVAGWWGIWHIISGLTIAYFWARKKSIPTT